MAERKQGGVELIAANTYAAQMERYCKGVESGNVIACKAVQAAVARHRVDMARQDTEDFPFRFDADRAEASCAFFMFALRHSIGSGWADKPFVLSPWQVFVNSNIFGWKRSDGTRKFRRVHISVAKKNGKSTYAAGLALSLLYADHESVAQIFVGATKFDQAKIIFDEAERMLRQSPHLLKISEVRRAPPSIISGWSFIKPLGSDRAFNGLNPHGVFFDELHEWKEHHREFYDAMTTGSGSRTQPLQVTTTTAGDQMSLLWREETEYCRDVLSGDHVDESLFAFLAELDAGDDPLDESVWEKANPNIDISISREYLREQATRAGRQATALNTFVRYHANREVSSSTSVIDRDEWDACAGQLSDWATADAICGGIDLGGGFDLAATAFCARWRIDTPTADDGGTPLYRFEIQSRSYIDTKSERDTTQQPWQQWIADGSLIASEWVLQRLGDDFLESAQSLGAAEFAFDPWNMKLLAEQLSEQGMTATEFPQRGPHYAEPIEQFLKAIDDGRITHDGNDEVLRWCATNLALKPGFRGGWMPDRKNSRSKIDAIVAVLMAFRMALFAPPTPLWFYAEQELEIS